MVRGLRWITLADGAKALGVDASDGPGCNKSVHQKGTNPVPNDIDDMLSTERTRENRKTHLPRRELEVGSASSSTQRFPSAAFSYSFTEKLKLCPQFQIFNRCAVVLVALPASVGRRQRRLAGWPRALRSQERLLARAGRPHSARHASDGPPRWLRVHHMSLTGPAGQAGRSECWSEGRSERRAAGLQVGA